MSAWQPFPKHSTHEENPYPTHPHTPFGGGAKSKTQIPNLPLLMGHQTSFSLCNSTRTYKDLRWGLPISKGRNVPIESRVQKDHCETKWRVLRDIVSLRRTSAGGEVSRGYLWVSRAKLLLLRKAVFTKGIKVCFAFPALPWIHPEY